MAEYNMFVGSDTTGNPQYETFNMNYDTRQSARLQEAQTLYNWNSMMYQNWYNSPEQQVERLQEAGLNPLFYLGHNAGTTPAATATSGLNQGSGRDSRLDQAMGLTKNTADVLLESQKQAIDYDLQRRQQQLDLRRIKVEEGRLGNETRKTTQDIEESKSRMSVNEGQLERWAHENNWTDEDIAKMHAEIAKTNKEIDALEVSMREAGSRIDLNYANIGKITHENAVLDAQVSELAARTGLERQQVETEIMKVYDLAASANLKTAEVEVQKGQKVVLEKTAEGIAIKNEQDRTYGGWERTQGIISGYIHSAAEAVNTVVNVKTGGAKAALDSARKRAFDSETDDYEEYKSLSRKQQTDPDSLTAAEEDRLDQLSDRYKGKRSNNTANPNFE